MSDLALWRVEIDGQARLARGPTDEGPADLLPAERTVDEILSRTGPSLTEALNEGVERCPSGARVLCPIGLQPVWAAGVTYKRSRTARLEESQDPSCYDRVYRADRPELFLKALPGAARGPRQPVGIRSDSTWNVPEPELTLILDSAGNLVALTIGDDVSSRSIEGENPLYLPQAKVYTGSCALGPCLVPIDNVTDVRDLKIELTCRRDGAVVVSEEASVAQMHRTIDELASWLFRAADFPTGAVLMTGTPIVPDDSFTLQTGDIVEISITGLGSLSNTVEVIQCS